MMAAIKGIKEHLDKIYNDYYEETKTVVTDEFIDTTIELKARPDNFKGVGDFSEASCELRKRSSKSPLTDEQIETLDDYNVTYEEVAITEAIPETYFFNPKIILNDKLAKKVSDALTSIPELKKMNIIFHQEAREAEIKNIVTEKSFEDASKIVNKNALRLIYDIISTVAISPKISESTDKTLRELLEFVREDGVRI